MKTWVWWIALLIPGLFASFVLLINADIIGPEDPPEPYVCDPEFEDCVDASYEEPECYVYYDDNGTEYVDCPAMGADAPPEDTNPDGFFNYIDRLPIPEHPAVAWTGFAVVMAGVLTKGTLVPMINAIDRARDNSRFNKKE